MCGGGGQRNTWDCRWHLRHASPEHSLIAEEGVVGAEAGDLPVGGGLGGGWTPWRGPPWRAALAGTPGSAPSSATSPRACAMLTPGQAVLD